MFFFYGRADFMVTPDPPTIQAHTLNSSYFVSLPTFSLSWFSSCYGPLCVFHYSTERGSETGRRGEKYRES